MRATEFITEDRITHIADMMNDKIIQRYEDETGDITSEITATEIVTRLAEASKKAIQWLVNRYIKGEFKLEDRFRIKNELKKFEKFKSKIPQKYRDLNKMSVVELYGVLDQIDDGEPVSNKAAEKQKKEALFKEGDAELIYKDSEVMIVVPKTEEASCEFGKGTKWCTAASGSHNYFDDYNSRGKLYIVMTKGDGKFQFHFDDDMFMDALDQELKPEHMTELTDKYPQIKTALNDVALQNVYLPLVANVTPEVEMDAVKRYGGALQYIKNPSIELQQLILRDGGLHNIQFIENPDPAIQLKALKMAAETDVGVSFIFSRINNPTDEAKIIGFANDPDMMTSFVGIDEKMLRAVLKKSHHNLKANPRLEKYIKPGQATFDIVDDDTGEVFTRWPGEY